VLVTLCDEYPSCTCYDGHGNNQYGFVLSRVSPKPPFLIWIEDPKTVSRRCWRLCFLRDVLHNRSFWVLWSAMRARLTKKIQIYVAVWKALRLSQMATSFLFHLYLTCAQAISSQVQCLQCLQSACLKVMILGDSSIQVIQHLVWLIWSELANTNGEAISNIKR